MKLPKSEALDILWGCVKGWSTVYEKIVDQRRWSTDYEAVFKSPEGKCYMTYFSRGSTECQEEQPWEYEDEVEFTEVEPIEITTVVYYPVKKEGE